MFIILAIYSEYNQITRLLLCHRRRLAPVALVLAGCIEEVEVDRRIVQKAHIATIDSLVSRVPSLNISLPLNLIIVLLLIL